MTWLEKKMDLTLILTMDLNFAVGKKGIALLEVAVNLGEALPSPHLN